MGSHGAKFSGIKQTSATTSPCKPISSRSIRKADGLGLPQPFANIRSVACGNGRIRESASSPPSPRKRHHLFRIRRARWTGGLHRVEKANAPCSRVDLWGAYCRGQSSTPDQKPPTESRFNLYSFETLPSKTRKPVRGHRHHCSGRWLRAMTSAGVSRRFPRFDSSPGTVRATGPAPGRLRRPPAFRIEPGPHATVTMATAARPRLRFARDRATGWLDYGSSLCRRCHRQPRPIPKIF